MNVSDWPGRAMEFSKRWITLGDKLEQTREDVKEIKREIRQLADAITDLKAEIKLVAEREKGAREAIALEVKNRQLEFENQVLRAMREAPRGRKWLPPGRPE